MKKLISILPFVLAINLCAQQQAMFTQYMFNMSALNPAVVGSHESISVTALARRQWVGIEGAPNTQTLSIHSPLLNEQAGVGLILLRDQIGVTTQHSMVASYAYRINFHRSALAFGLQVSGNQYQSDQTQLSPNNADMAVNENYNSGLKPNFGTGAYFYSEKAYIGISIPVLLKTEFIGGQSLDGEDRSLRRHVFLMSGYVFDLSPTLKLKPNFLVKAVQGSPLSADINANLLIDEIVWVGLSYRSFDSIDALLELQVTPELRIGYAHDFTTSEIREVSNGTHEFMINYRFKLKNKQEVSPRYF